MFKIMMVDKINGEQIEVYSGNNWTITSKFVHVFQYRHPDYCFFITFK